jgi:hypothetical protein
MVQVQPNRGGPEIPVLPSLPSRREGRGITKPEGSGRLGCRPHLNHPPTAVGGIPGVFAQSLPWVGFAQDTFMVVHTESHPLTKEHLEEDHTRTHKRFGQNRLD